MNIKKIVTFKACCITLACILFNIYPNMALSHTVEDEDRSVLIVYDANVQGRSTGYLNSVFLANLLGHFNKKATIIPLEQYQAGELNAYEVTFYLGVNSQLMPQLQRFTQDALSSAHTIVWFRYNIEHLIHSDTHFLQHFGFEFAGIDRSGRDQVIYKDTPFDRNSADREMGRIIVHDQQKVQQLAVAADDAEDTIPYIIHSQHLWYIADIAFTYLTENDRYLIFADVLYDILTIDAPIKKRALLRLEDISPAYNLAILKEITDYLYSEHVPFSIALIPYYCDPLNTNNNIKITESGPFLDTLHEMLLKGGQLILHGYTHQYARRRNPFNGESGKDFEFYRVKSNPQKDIITPLHPVKEDSLTWVSQRIDMAQSLLRDAGLTTSIWETPHYMASQLDNEYFARVFSSISGRVTYFDNNNPDAFATQFFPYIIQRDAYGQKVLPDNLGYFSPERTSQDIILSAKRNLVLRDAWASLYYHPYLGVKDLQQIIQAIKALGYEFVTITPQLS